MKHIGAAVIIIFSSLAAAAPPASAPGVNKNIRCLMLSNLYAKSAKDDRGRQAAAETRLFYLGRVDDRMTDAQLEAAMLAAGKAITPDTAGAEMDKCAQLLEQRSRAMTLIGDRLRSKLAP